MTLPTAWPSADEAVAIHSRLCAGDPVAPADLAVAFLDPLAAWVLRANPRVDPHLCEHAAEEAILSLIKNPRSYRPDKSTLDAYLRMSARGDLRNLLERERRHSARRADLEVVELFGPDRNPVQAEADPATIFEHEEDERSWIRQTIPSVVAGSFTRQEDAVLALLRLGERSTSAYAQALGITHLAKGEQRREVKRIKDRIKRRLQRIRGKDERAD